MNLYSNKQRWKILLLIVALVFIGLSLWYSNTIVERVRKRERARVEQWGEAIRKKASLVKLTNNTFQELQNKERLKVELWAKAIKELAKPQEDYTFFVDLVQRNDNIPVILVNDRGKIINHTNIIDPKDSLNRSQINDSLKMLKKIWEEEIKPIEFNYIEGKKQYIYHHTSKRLITLKKRRDSLVKSFNKDLIKNESLPVLFVNQDSPEILATNMSEETIKKRGGLEQVIKQMKAVNHPIEISFGGYQSGNIYYENSQEVQLLRYYPIIQFAILGLLILVGYLVFSTFRKAEQDQVWVGMSKETAHQLGTPLSSLMAWSQYLESKDVPPNTIEEINKDIDRLKIITDRFSKIGSGGQLAAEKVYPLLEKSIAYLQTRLSSKIEFNLHCKNQNIQAYINPPLLEWVIENIAKNAVDAMKGTGQLDVTLSEESKKVIIDIKDTGKGISSSKLKTVFNPGYTTKKRGWGLGLSLAKRIIKAYHKGKIYVAESEIDRGTIFRVVLKKAE